MLKRFSFVVAFIGIILKSVSVCGSDCGEGPRRQARTSFISPLHRHMVITPVLTNVHGRILTEAWTFPQVDIFLPFQVVVNLAGSKWG